MSDWDNELAAPVDIFQDTRDKIARDIAGIMELLNNKQIEMFAEIDKLEEDFKDKQQQQLSSLNKLSSIKSRTEEELGENNLIEIQHNVIRELQVGIDKLSLDIERGSEPSFGIEVKWGMCMNSLPSKIGDSEIAVVGLTPVTTQHKQSCSPERRSRGDRRRQGPTKSRLDCDDSWGNTPRIDWEDSGWPSVEDES